jgi:tetratricopeptide (TPR) repeat protein
MCDREPLVPCQAPVLMGAGNRSPAAASSQSQGLADLAQSWCYLAAQLAPEVPELPAVIQQEVGTLASAQITEDLLQRKAAAIAQRVEEAGMAEQAGHLLHRMGRPMYELLLLLATEEELRAAGMMATTPTPGQDPGRPAARQSGPQSGQAANRTAAPDRDGAPAALVVVRPTGSQSARPSSPRVTDYPGGRGATAPAPGTAGREAPATAATPAVAAPPSSSEEPSGHPPRTAAAPPGSSSSEGDAATTGGTSATRGWTERISPRAALERERQRQEREALLRERERWLGEERLHTERRLAEMPALVAEIVPQALRLARAVAERGLARKALRSASKLPSQAELGTAGDRLSELLGARKWVDAAALAVHLAESLPGEAASELACRTGEACRQAGEVDLAILCLTNAILSAPPCEAACRQLSDLCLEWTRPRQAPSRSLLYAPARIDIEEETRDPRLALVWLELLARVLRVRGADAEAIAAYQQLLHLAPGRDDVRAMLEVAAHSGRLPS